MFTGNTFQQMLSRNLLTRQLLTRQLLVLCISVTLVIFLVSCSETQADTATSEPSVMMIEQPPDSSDSIVEGNELFMAGYYTAAIKKYAEDIKDSRSLSAYNTAVAYYRLGQNDKALEFFRKALQIQPTYRVAILSYSSLLIEMARYNEALSHLSKLPPEVLDPGTNSLIALVHIKLGNAALASYHIEQADPNNSNNRLVITNYASYLMAIGQYDQAIAVLNRITVKDASSLLAEAEVYYGLGDYEQAGAIAGGAADMPNTTMVQKARLVEILDMAELFFPAIDVMKELILTDNNYQNRYKLAELYYKSEQYDKAYDTIMDTVRSGFDDERQTVLLYKTLVAKQSIREAGIVLQKAYDSFGSDMILYYQFRHQIIQDSKSGSLDHLLPLLEEKDRLSDYALMASALYHLLERHEEESISFLNRVSAKNSLEYYTTHVSVHLTFGNYAAAREYSEMLYKWDPEYYWYNLITYWNLGDQDKIRQLNAKFFGKRVVGLRLPKLEFKFVPTIRDLDFKYRFESDPVHVVKSLMYPIFLSSDAINNNLRVSESLIRNSEEELGLSQLTRTNLAAQSIKLNNLGVQYMLSYQYEDAENYLLQAYELDKSNAYSTYNLGLLYMFLGNVERSKHFYSTTLELNEYVVPALVGLGVLEYERGATSLSREYFSNAVRYLDRAGEISDNANVGAELFNSMFLALIALDDHVRYRNGYNDYSFRDNNSQLEVFSVFHRFFATGKLKVSGQKEDLQMHYRTLATAKLLEAYNVSVNYEDLNYTSIDRVTRFYTKYVQMRRLGMVDSRYMDEYQQDSVALIENIYYNVVLGNRNDAYHYLQQVAGMEIANPELLKASYIYYLWMNDYPNAEASRDLLDSLSYNDKFIKLYDMAYELVVGHLENLKGEVDEYKREYGQEDRLLLLEMFYWLSFAELTEFERTFNAFIGSNKIGISDSPISMQLGNL